MDVLSISADGVQRHEPGALGAVRSGTGLVWVDVASWDDESAEILTEHFGLQPRAVTDCANRNPVPKVHVYPEHVFVVLHAPERGERGHVHYLELDQFIGPDYLITVHGPVNKAVDPTAALAETASVERRLESGRLRPKTPVELSFAVVTAIANRMRTYMTSLTEEVWRLEQAVTAGHLGDPEEFLEELFQVRHGLLAVRTMCALSREVYGRMRTLEIFGADGLGSVVDLEDQFRRVAAMADSQREYLQGVIEFYQTRTNTKMTIAAERLAVIAAVTLPITALSSILGMNVIVNETTQVGPLAVLLAVMAAISATMLVWARRKGWF